MNYTNEEIARAAGLEYPVPTMIDQYGQQCVSYVDWRNDPGAVATWLLPVLEKRMPAQLSFTSFRDSSYGKWCAQGVSGNGNDLSCVYAPTWHECVIEAIMATRENNKESESE